jgi:cytidylate kinase
MRLGRGRSESVKKITITIDGPAGSGKSTTARLVAIRLGYRYLDTGAMYRAVALKCLNEGVAFDDEGRVTGVAESASLGFRWDEDPAGVELDGRDVTDEIRAPAVSEGASKIGTLSAFREVLVAKQRELGRGGGVVAEGRDMGTVVFPDAELKIYMDAEIGERVRRRAMQYPLGGMQADLDLLRKELEDRDSRDSTREAGPLVAATDAVRIDTTSLSIEEQVNAVVRLAGEILEDGPKR